MSSLFCDRCGTLFDTPKHDQDCMTCSYCNFKVDVSQGILDNVITKSAERKQADWACEITDTENNTNNDSIAKKHATIDEPCPKCAHPVMYFYTMQLRSVDEGQTVFYECQKCQYKYAVNN